MSAAVGGAAVTCTGVVHVYRAFGTDTAALRGIDLAVPPGQQLALLGPSGSGKSTLLTLLAGIRQPSAGQIYIDDRDIARLPESALRQYRARTVGTLLQGASGNLLPWASAAANVRYAKRAYRHRRAEPVDLLDAVGLPVPLRRIAVARLSPGQQQTVALAVALANEPRLLVADEPTSQLDPVSRDAVLDVLLTVTAGLGTTVIVVTHDRAVAGRMHRTLHLRDGRVGAEEHEQERLPVLGADRSVQLPDHVVTDWVTGTRVRVEAISPDEIRIRRVEP